MDNFGFGIADASAEFDENLISPLRPFHNFLSSPNSTTSSAADSGLTASSSGQNPMAFDVKTPLPLPKKRPVQILHKIHYQRRPNDYFVKWEEEGKNKEKHTTTWETEENASTQCRELIQKFEEKLKAVPKLARKLTHYQVRTILDRTVDDGSDEEPHYLVEWVGWDEPTWEKKHWLLPSYAKMLAEFDALNGIEGELDEPMAKKRKINVPREKEKYSVWMVPPKTTPQAIKVLAKIDRGNEMVPSYLVEWPEGSGKRAQSDAIQTAGGPNASWEKHISIGNKNAIDQFEAALKKNAKWAKRGVRYEIEQIVGKRLNKKKGVVEYLAKWRGSTDQYWMDTEGILNPDDKLVMEFELAKLRKGKNLKFNGKYFEKNVVPEEAVRQFLEIFGKIAGEK